MRISSNILSYKATGILKSPRFLLFIGFLLLNSFFAFQLKSPIASADEGYVFAQTQYFSGEEFRHLGSAYYGYFQALLYTPLFFLFQNNFIVYKGMLFINSIFAALIPVIAYTICTKYLRFSEKRGGALAVFSGLFPPVVSYSKLIWNENTLYITLWAILFLVVKELCNQENKKQKVLSSFLIALLSVMAIAAHNRGIEYLAAIFFTALFLPLITKRKIVHLPVFIISAILLFLLHSYLSDSIYSLLWAGNDTASNTTGSYLSNLKTILQNPGAFSLFCKTLIGHLYSAFVSYFGLVCMSLIVCLSAISHYMKSRKGTAIDSQNNHVSDMMFSLSSFAIILFVLGMLVSILFYLPGILEQSRYVKMITTRYTDNGASILIFVGLCVFTTQWSHIKKHFWVGVPLFFGVAVLFWIYVQPLLKDLEFTNYLVVQALHLLPFMTFSASFNNQALLHMTLISSVVFVMLFLLAYRKKNLLCAGIAVSVFLAVTISCFYNITWYYSSGTYDSAARYQAIIEDFVEEYPNQKTNLYISMLYESSISYYLLYEDVLDVTDSLNKAQQQYDNTFYASLNMPLGYDTFSDMFCIELPAKTVQNKFFSFDSSYLYLKGDQLIRYAQEQGYTLAQTEPHFTYNNHLYALGSYTINADNTIALNNGGTQYGPYLAAPAGTYKVTVNGENLQNASFAVTAKGGTVQLAYTISEIGSHKAVYEFEITEENISSIGNGEYLESVEFVNTNQSSDAIMIRSVDVEKQ